MEFFITNTYKIDDYFFFVDEKVNSPFMKEVSRALVQNGPYNLTVSSSTPPAPVPVSLGVIRIFAGTEKKMIFNDTKKNNSNYSNRHNHFSAQRVCLSMPPVLSNLKKTKMSYTHFFQPILI